MRPDLDKPIWGVPAIAEIINRSPTKTYYLLEKGYVPGRKIGKLWTSTPRLGLGYSVGTPKKPDHSQSPRGITV